MVKSSVATHVACSDRILQFWKHHTGDFFCAVQVIMVGAPMAKVHLKAGDMDVDVQLRDPNKELNACWCAPLISIRVPWLHCVALTHDLSGCRKFVNFVDVVPYLSLIHI